MTTRKLSQTTATAEGYASPPADAPRRDGEYDALVTLAGVHTTTRTAKKPDDALQAICDAAKELTHGRYAALAITDSRDRTEGFYTSGLTREELKGLKVPPAGHGPLGSLRTDGKPIRIDDLDSAAKAFGFPPRHPVMKRMLGVPIWAQGEVRGSMYVTDRSDDRQFDDDDEQAMVTLARHATYVVENLWY